MNRIDGIFERARHLGLALLGAGLCAAAIGCQDELLPAGSSASTAQAPSVAVASADVPNPPAEPGAQAPPAGTARPGGAGGRPVGRTDGWTGADAAYSVDLLDGRVLWLFADTWIGKVANGSHQAGTKLVNNSIGLHAKPPAGQAPKEITFHWGGWDEKMNPVSWIIPRPPIVPEASVGKLDLAGWYWVADGIVAPDAQGKPRLVVFQWHMGHRPKGEGVWNFMTRGGTIAVVDRFAQPPDQWVIHQWPNPHASDEKLAPATPATPATPVAPAKKSHYTWGCELLRLPAEPGRADVDILIYGTRRTPKGNSELVAARAPSSQLEVPSAWRFRTADGWSEKLDDSAALAQGMPSEFSIHQTTRAGKPLWVMIHSEHLLGPHVMARTAAGPFGPWGKPAPIYRCPDLAKNKQYFAYAGKAHEELSAPGTVLITYAVNSHDFWAMLRDASIYRPRFISVKVDDLPPLKE